MLMPSELNAPEHVQTYKYRFEDPEDKSFALTYVEALEALLKKGHIKYAGQSRYDLTSEGYKAYKKIKEGVDSSK